MIMDFSGCDAVELWVKDHDKYFRCKANRLPGSSFSCEIKPCEQNEKGEILPSSDDDPNLVCLCRDLILGHVDLPQPGFTRNGSFWLGDKKKPLSLLSKPERKSYVHGFKIGGDYPSIAVIPIAVEHQNIGLLQLKNKHRNSFTENEIELYEGLAQSLGIALAHRHAEVDLRERIKELTCLYSIARLADQPDLSMEEILQNIVEVLPPAWLYPEITCAKIILDGHAYSTPNFRDGRYQQRADIIVNGERRGSVEIVYLEEKPELDEGPFLREERILLDTVTKEVAIIIMRRQAEQEKMKLEEQLRHADRLATIGQLAAGVAHELNEPLSNILGFAQLAKKCQGLPKQADLDIEKILTASLSAREVVKKLLIFARKLPPRKTRINVNQLVEEGLHFFESRCAKEGIELVRSLSSDLPEIAADPAQLNQVLVNLVVNALQAMPEGGKLKVQTLNEGGYVSLIIEDTGTGMREEVLNKIFTPFFTTKDVGQGTGLGLPVVHGIVTSHGGSIKVESKVGYGTRCKIQLPVEQDLL
jgi:signal transduction histidine kinase